jgi:hypothetical protein
MEESFLRKIQRWRKNEGHFKAEWRGELKHWVVTHPRLTYFLGVIAVGWVILEFFA